MVHGVVLHEGHCPVGQDFHRIEQRRGVRPCRDDYAPQVAYVAEEHRKRRKRHANACAEQHHVYEQKRQGEQTHMRHNLEEDHYRSDRNKRNAEVHQLEQHFFQWEDELFDADLLDERRRFDDGVHGARGGVGHQREHYVAQNYVQRVVFDAEFEERAEHNGEHNHHKQRVEHRPKYTQGAAAVFQFEVSGHQGSDGEPIPSGISA